MLLLPGTVGLTLWYPVSLYVIANLRRPGTATIILGCALAVSLPLYYSMIVWLGMTGAAIASSIVYLAVLTGGVAVLARMTSLTLGDLVPRRTDLAQLVSVARAALRSVRGARGGG